MAAIDDFLGRHPDLNQDDAEVLGDAGGVRLDVTVLGVSPRYVRFAHLGTEYSVEREHVLDVADREEPAAGRGAATLTLALDAPVHASYTVSAGDLSSSVPFSLSRPPSAAPRRIRVSSRELAWRRANGLTTAAAYSDDAQVLDAYATGTGCDSRTSGGWDDTITDDERADY